MAKMTRKLQAHADGSFSHWCPACQHLHPIPAGRWTFNGDMQRPSFSPSLKQMGKRIEVEHGRWTGEWILDEAGNAADGTCHYFITDGNIQFCPDSWHKRSDVVVLPDIPAHLTPDDL